MLRLTMRRLQGWGQAAGGAAAGGGGWGQANAQAGAGDKAWGGGAAAGGGWGGQAAAAAPAAGGWGAAAAPDATAAGGWGSQASTDAGGFEYRKLTPPMLLEVVKGEPGETHEYYAKMYFGPGSANAVKHNLWQYLKRFGHVTMERTATGESPRWYPINFKAKPPKIKIYDGDEWDLSVLPEHQVKNPSKASVIAEQRRLAGEASAGAFGGLPRAGLAKSTWGGSSGSIDPEWAAAATGGGSAGSWGAPSSGNDQAGETWAAPASTQEAGSSAGGWGQDTATTSASYSETQETPAATPQNEAPAGDGYGETPGAQAEATPAAPVEEPTPEPAAPAAPKGPMTIQDKIYQVVSENPGQPMHDYIDLLEKDSDKTQAPSVFRELRTGGTLIRRPLDAGGFVWQPVAQQQY